MLKNDFDKKFYFLCIIIFWKNKRNLVILNTCSFHKKMLSNFLPCVLIYSLKKCVLEDGFKDSCSEIFVRLAEIRPWQSLLLRKLQYLESQQFWKKCYTKYNFLGICEIFNITNSANLDCQMCQWIRNNKFRLFRFRQL